MSGYQIAMALLILSAILVYNGAYSCILTFALSAVFAVARKLIGSIKII